jgi:hypothetical protein
VPRYHCRGGNINHGAKLCISFGGLRADQAITELVLEALEPVGIEASVRAWEATREHRDQKTQALTLALEKARYEAERARRQYDAVEPENRLVATELETRWNAALAQVTETELTLEAARSAGPSLGEPQRQRLMQLGGDLRLLWEHAETPVALKKRVLRTVIEEIVADVDEPTSEISFRVHWAGGVHTPLRVRKNRIGVHGRTTDREVVDLVRELAKVSSDASIASFLNRLGRVTGAGHTWNESRVRTARENNGIARVGVAAERPWITLAEAAEQLRVNAGVVRKLMERRVLPAKQVVRGAPWVINRTDLQLAEVQSYVAAVHRGQHAPRHDADQTLMPLI